MQEIEIGRFVVADGGHHRFVGAVGDRIAEAGFLAFELIPEAAGGTGEIAGFGVGDEAIEFWRTAIWAVEIVFGPGFRDDSSALGTAFVDGGVGAGHGQIHAESRSMPTPIYKTDARVGAIFKSLELKFCILMRSNFLRDPSVIL